MGQPTRLPSISSTIGRCIAGPSIAVAALLAFWPTICQPAFAQPVRIYIGNDDHTDLMWTANQAVYESTYVDMLDFHLALADQTASNPAPYRNRFNADGHHWLWAYQSKKSPEAFDRLMERIKDGTISVPLNCVVSCYGAQPTEAVLRGMYYPGRLERTYDYRFRLAVAMENQGLPLGLASLFSGSGGLYSWRGVCGCATRMNKDSLTRRPREIFWWTGPDGRRLLLKWHSLWPSNNQSSGGYSEAFDPTAAVEFLSRNATFLRRYRVPGASEPYQVRAAFGFGWDALARKTGQPYAADPQTYPQVDHFHQVAERMSDASRQVIVSNQLDFFEDFESLYGATLTTRSETYGNEWDLYSASMSETSARVRRAVERLRSAEFLAALVSLKQPGFLTPYRNARDLAFRNLGLYWEHNWTADGPITRDQRAAWQQGLCEQIEQYVNDLYNAALASVEHQIPRPSNAYRFFVANPLGWNRTDAADIGYIGDSNIHVVDVSTGREVPHQIVTLDGANFLRILASDVPSAGYKVYEVHPGPAIQRANAANISGNDRISLDNVNLGVTIEADGAISSLIDKRNGRYDWAATIDGYQLNDFAGRSNAGQPLVVENVGPVSVSVRAESGAGIRHSSLITVYRSSNRVDIHNVIRENFANTRHCSFSFSCESPSVFSEEVGAINLNKLKSAGGAYATSHARYDYITVNHFAEIRDRSSTRGVVVSNADLPFARMGNSTPTTLDTTTPQLNFLIGGQVDGPNLGIPAQWGNNYFNQRFALRPTSDYDPAASMRFAMEHQNPFITGYVQAIDQGKLPADTYSLLSVNNPNTLLWALKVHDDGIQKGLVTRFWNLSNVAVQSSVDVHSPIRSAFRTTHLETDISPAQFNGNSLTTFFAPQQIQTYRLQP